MGWKNVKDYYKIGHTVQVTNEGICIGSPYIHNIIVIGFNGRILKRYGLPGNNKDLARYTREMEAGPAKLSNLVQSTDCFTESIIVYTYRDGDIIEKQCETLGWPNVTHDGDMMYKNTFSADKEKVVGWAKENADIGIKFAGERVADAEEHLAKCREQLAKEEANRVKLEAAYPSSSIPPREIAI